MGLTRKQRELMNYLFDYILEHGYSPTYEELGRRLNRSLSTVHEHVRRLAAKGMLRVDYNRQRSIEILRFDDRAQKYPEIFPRAEWLVRECNGYPLSPMPSPEESVAEIRSCRERWYALRSQMRPGDEMWTFCVPPSYWNVSLGRAGYALVRERAVVGGVTTHDQLEQPEEKRRTG